MEHNMQSLLLESLYLTQTVKGRCHWYWKPWTTAARRIKRRVHLKEFTKDTDSESHQKRKKKLDQLKKEFNIDFFTDEIGTDLF